MYVVTSNCCYGVGAGMTTAMECMSQEAMEYFLSLLTINNTLVYNVLTLFTGSGPVEYWFNGETFCLIKERLTS